MDLLGNTLTTIKPKVNQKPISCVVLEDYTDGRGDVDNEPLNLDQTIEQIEKHGSLPRKQTSNKDGSVTIPQPKLLSQPSTASRTTNSLLSQRPQLSSSFTVSSVPGMVMNARKPSLSISASVAPKSAATSSTTSSSKPTSSTMSGQLISSPHVSTVHHGTNSLITLPSKLPFNKSPLLPPPPPSLATSSSSLSSSFSSLSQSVRPTTTGSSSANSGRQHSHASDLRIVGGSEISMSTLLRNAEPTEASHRERMGVIATYIASLNAAAPAGTPPVTLSGLKRPSGGAVGGGVPGLSQSSIKQPRTDSRPSSTSSSSSSSSSIGAAKGPIKDKPKPAASPSRPGDLTEEDLRELMNRKSAHFEEAEEEWFDGYGKRMDKLAQREYRMAEQDARTSIKINAFFCADCKLTTEAIGPLCRPKGHNVSVISATKRYFECTTCSRRDYTLGALAQALPTRPCSCAAPNWRACGSRGTQLGSSTGVGSGSGATGSAVGLGGEKMVMTASDWTSRKDLQSIKSMAGAL